MLTPRYINGFDRENNNNLAIAGRFSPYVPTPTYYVAYSLGRTPFSQGESITGYQGGRGWFIFNTAFWEVNYTARLGAAYNSVAYHGYFMALNSDGDAGLPVYPRVLFLRFENGSNNVSISLRLRTDGRIEIMRGGVGDSANTAGVVLFVTTETMTPSTWEEIEIRIDSGASGRVRMWFRNAEVCDLSVNTGQSAIDRVTFRWEAFGRKGMGVDHMAIFTDDTVSGDRIGPALIKTYLPVADYQTDALWMPSAGVNHYSRIGESIGVTPDNDGTYLAGSGLSGDDLYTFEPPACYGRNLALALNIDRRAVSGSPLVNPLLLHPQGGGVRSLGTSTALATGYEYDQFLTGLDPVTGDYWTDADLQAAAFGMRGAGSGASRVAYMHLEKLTSLLGYPYECGEGGSYIL